MNVVHQGPASSALPITNQFNAVSPLHVSEQQVPYNKISKALALDIDAAACQKTFNWNLHPVNLMRYNTTAMHKVYNVFSDLVKQKAFSNSAFLLESYGTKAVKAVDERTTAIPREERERNLLM